MGHGPGGNASAAHGAKSHGDHSSVDDHSALIAAMLDSVPARPPDQVPIDDALGRVTALPVQSPVDLPLFRNSQMDGFAVRSADIARLPATLEITGEIAAGPGAPNPLRPGTAARIMTGATVPEGADAVVPIEDCTVSGTDGDWVEIRFIRPGNSYVRARGSDIARGAELLPTGLRLAARHLGALAAAGLTHVEVAPQLRVAVLTTGTELIPPGSDPMPGEVYDSNGTALVAAVRAAGAVVALREHVPDDTAAMRAVLGRAARDADLIITSGGISMGSYEVVRETLEPVGARVGHVAMQPGGPQATAVFGDTPVVCLPGNPVSTQVSFEVFVAPLLRALAALPQPERRQRRLMSATSSVAGKRQFLRGRTISDNEVVLVAGPSSHLVAGLAASDVLVVIPESVTEVAAGDFVETWAL